MDDLAVRLLRRAQQYARTARSALDATDYDAAFENARTAAELAGKAGLHAKTGRYGQKHNIAGAMVQAGIWPRSQGAPLAKLLDEYVRGVYSFTRPVRIQDAVKAFRLAAKVVEAASEHIRS